MQNGTLFTEDFLREGIKSTQDWKGFGAADRDVIVSELRSIIAPFASGAELNEADTEARIIYPVLDALGWKGLVIRQATMAARGREDVPDGLLLPDEAALREADKTQRYPNKFRFGAAICESKKWERGLDAGQGGDVPSTQMLRYLTRADVMSDGRILWGILTNGRVWRLYWQRAKSRSEQFVEFDLGALLPIEGYKPDLFASNAAEAQHLLAVFILMFRRAAFLPTRAQDRTFHQEALEEGRSWEARVAKSLSTLVFGEVFPGFISAIAAAAPEVSLGEAREAALTLLYRLLFVLYAEDRDLLPKRDRRYREYGLHDPVRLDIAEKIDSGAAFSARAPQYWNHLRTLFRLIDDGDSGIGLPPYNGGLFNRKENALLDRIEIPDAAFAPLLDKLSRTQIDRRLINYRDLSVQQLGSIYERILEYEPVRDVGGEIKIRLNPFARKGSGSYYTPDELVLLIIAQTVGPLIRERREAFERAAATLKSDRRPVPERLEDLERHDFASALLELKVCDPAMGSGHFLVRLVDYLADAVIEALANAPIAVSWGEYKSPLAQRIASIRARILDEARANGWVVREDQLEDRLIVRRLVLKRVVFGVDKNPMAVELAKVSLWLHTFTVGAPLSFLDHHLREGDSLFGEWVRKTSDELSEKAGIFMHSTVVHARQAARMMLDIETAADADLAEVRKSAERFGGVREATDPLIVLLSLWHACRWLPDTSERRSTKDLLFRGAFGDPAELFTGKQRISGESGQVSNKQAAQLLNSAVHLAEQERFLHWEVAFPGVWADWESAEPQGGFDAVIGNPPWDRLKMQEVEWFAARKPEIALAPRAADRKRMIERLKKDEDPLYDQYEEARDHADMALELARKSGEYKLLGRGDINIYALFVERAQRLIKPDGIAGLLVPSGIASDKGAAEFFRSIATTARLVALLDFENRGRESEDFFPDVDSRFKFCAFVAAGQKCEAESALCGFFLRDSDAVQLASEGGSAVASSETVFPLKPDDFRLVNPNTGTAPIFRTRRDAKLTIAIYERLPILVHRDDDGEILDIAWPVRYCTMFHMTNDSHLFWAKERLEAEKAYPVAGGRWQKGKQLFVPLYEGKMVQAFDHRAASVTVNPRNVHRPAQPEPSTLDQHRDLSWTPTPQFWVESATVKEANPAAWSLGFKEITAVTNVRTMIAVIVPAVGFGNKLPLLLEENDGPATDLAPFLVANFNSFAYDFVARQKVHGQTMNLFILEQLPVVPAEAYARKFGQRTAGDIVRDSVLRLSYTANDLAAFARDMGHVDPKSGEVLPPFKWDEEERAHLRARLDALYFLLYGIADRDDVRYILDTFPIVKRDDEKAFGRYRTADLILAYMNALDAGDSETKVAL